MTIMSVMRTTTYILNLKIVKEIYAERTRIVIIANSND